MKLPEPPEASAILELAVVGFAEVLQHTPLAVTGLPLSAVIFPPEVAVVCAIEVIAIVVNAATAI